MESLKTMPPALTHDLTELLGEWYRGDEAALHRLMEEIYDELRRRAHLLMKNEPAAHSWQATDLVHELYQRIGGGRPRAYADRAHFLNACARVMRWILADHARARRPYWNNRESLTAAARVRGHQDLDHLAMDQALERLRLTHPRMAAVFAWKFYLGLSHQEIANTTGLHVDNISKEYQKAKTRVYLLMNDEEPHVGESVPGINGRPGGNAGNGPRHGA
ncbi:MAG: ECF-type sigma factor [Blastocatellia bacterium]